MVSTELISEFMSYLVSTVAQPSYGYMQGEYLSPKMLSTGIESIFFKTLEHFHIHNKKS